VVVEMEVEVETVVEATSRRRRSSSLRRWCVADEAVEKGMPTVVVTTIEWRRLFYRRQRCEKRREEARSRWKKERELTVAYERRRCVEEAQRRRDVSPAPPLPLRKRCDALFMCQ
jgi:hypothetical protein